MPLPKQGATCVSQGGTDVGDHPPITPVATATEAELGGDAWRLYDYVTRHFLGTVSPDCVFKRTKAVFTCSGETFTATGTSAARPGFTAVMPWKVCLTLTGGCHWLGRMCGAKCKTCITVQVVTCSVCTMVLPTTSQQRTCSSEN